MSDEAKLAYVKQYKTYVQANLNWMKEMKEGTYKVYGIEENPVVDDSVVDEMAAVRRQGVFDPLDPRNDLKAYLDTFPLVKPKRKVKAYVEEIVPLPPVQDWRTPGSDPK